MLWKSFILLFLVLLLIFNWGYVSEWLYYFDWRFIADKVNNLMPEFLSADYFDYFASEQGVLKIPKIDIEVPILFPIALDEPENRKSFDFDKLLKKGVLHYPESALPGEQGTAIILGHSAPLNWPKINYDWAFSNIDALEKGDEIIVSYQGNRFVYIVDSQEIIPKQSLENLSRSDLDSFHNLVISTCWPRGKDEKRLIVSATLDR